MLGQRDGKKEKKGGTLSNREESWAEKKLETGKPGKEKKKNLIEKERKGGRGVQERPSGYSKISQQTKGERRITPRGSGKAPKTIISNTNWGARREQKKKGWTTPSLGRGELQIKD